MSKNYTNVFRRFQALFRQLGVANEKVSHWQAKADAIGLDIQQVINDHPDLAGSLMELAEQLQSLAEKEE